MIEFFFCIESETNLDTIKDSYTNTVNELTQELSVIKEELGQVTERCQELEKDNLDIRSGNSHRSLRSTKFSFVLYRIRE